MAATVVLLSAPSGALASTSRFGGDRRPVVDASAYLAHLAAVRSHWARRPALPDYVSPVTTVELALALLVLVVVAMPRALPAVRRARPAVRGPPTRVEQPVSYPRTSTLGDPP